jgi:hypothetical protein
MAEDGTYPIGTFNQVVAAQLDQFAKLVEQTTKVEPLHQEINDSSEGLD